MTKDYQSKEGGKIMILNKIKEVLSQAKLSTENKKKAEKIYEKMKGDGVTDLLRGQLLQVIVDETEMNKTELQYFKDLKATIESILSDAENRLRMANEEIEEGDK
jgi:hypothetical protein